MPSLSHLAAATAVAFLAVTGVQAQQRSVGAAKTTGPSASARAAQAAPNPAGLRPPIPAGLTSGSGAAVAGDPVAAGNSVTRGNVAGINGGIASGAGVNNTGAGIASNGTGTSAGVDTTVLGAGAVGVMARGPSQSVPMGSSGLNPVEVARNFINADGNRDGELTRGEASRLSFSLSTFEEMDRDFDGVVTRAEYGDATR